MANGGAGGTEAGAAGAGMVSGMTARDRRTLSPSPLATAPADAMTAPAPSPQSTTSRRVPVTCPPTTW